MPVRHSQHSSGRVGRLPTLDYYDSVSWGDPFDGSAFDLNDGDYYAIIAKQPRCSACGTLVYYQDGLRCPVCGC